MRIASTFSTSCLFTSKLLPVCIALSGCTGEFLGERHPGDDTYLNPGWTFHANDDGTASATGSIGVDPDTDRSFVARALISIDTSQGADGSTAITSTSSTPTTALFSVPRDGQGAIGRRDVTERSDLRILFPGGDPLLMGEEGGVDHLERVDAQTLSTTDIIETKARYAGTRLSPSKRFLAVADCSEDPSPIHVIDLESHDIEIVPHDAFWLEAMWAHDDDTLFAVLFYGDDKTPRPAKAKDAKRRARIVGFHYADVIASGFAHDADGLWSKRTFDVDVPGAFPDFFFSFTWVGVSPDDRTVAIPLVLAGDHVVVLVDTASGNARLVRDASGPVGFTPDGTTVISYRETHAPPCRMETAKECALQAEPPSELVLIDVADLTTAIVPLPGIEFPTFFTSRDGNTVVVADSLNHGKLVIADLDNKKATQMAGPAVSFEELVQRADPPEAFIADEGLFRVDLTTAQVTAFDTDVKAEHINLLANGPARLVVDDGTGNGLVFIDPDAPANETHVALH